MALTQKNHAGSWRISWMMRIHRRSSTCVPAPRCVRVMLKGRPAPALATACEPLRAAHPDAQPEVACYPGVLARRKLRDRPGVCLSAQIMAPVTGLSPLSPLCSGAGGSRDHRGVHRHHARHPLPGPQRHAPQRHALPRHLNPVPPGCAGPRTAPRSCRWAAGAVPPGCARPAQKTYLHMICAGGQDGVK